MSKFKLTKIEWIVAQFYIRFNPNGLKGYIKRVKRKRVMEYANRKQF